MCWGIVVVTVGVLPPCAFRCHGREPVVVSRCPGVLMGRCVAGQVSRCVWQCVSALTCSVRFFQHDSHKKPQAGQITPYLIEMANVSIALVSVPEEEQRQIIVSDRKLSDLSQEGSGDLVCMIWIIQCPLLLPCLIVLRDEHLVYHLLLGPYYDPVPVFSIVAPPWVNDVIRKWHSCAVVEVANGVVTVPPTQWAQDPLIVAVMMRAIITVWVKSQSHDVVVVKFDFVGKPVE